MLRQAGFDATQPAGVASTGVGMYLTGEANRSVLQQTAGLAAGSVLAMTFMLPVEALPAYVRPGIEVALKGARANGTPFISFYMPDETV